VTYNMIYVVTYNIIAWPRATLASSHQYLLSTAHSGPSTPSQMVYTSHISRWTSYVHKQFFSTRTACILHDKKHRSKGKHGQTLNKFELPNPENSQEGRQRTNRALLSKLWISTNSFPVRWRPLHIWPETTDEARHRLFSSCAVQLQWRQFPRANGSKRGASQLNRGGAQSMPVWPTMQGAGMIGTSACACCT
jgi:hypothetical protein